MALSKVQEIFFKESQMRNSQGELYPCYHWTKNEFSEFDPATISSESGDDGYFGKGFYFTGDKYFNSCCFLYPEEIEAGKKQIQLECYLDIKNPFDMEKLGEGTYGTEEYHLYDKYNFLQFIKENAPSSYKIVLSDDDFVLYLKEEGYYWDYQELIDQHQAGEISFDDEIDGNSLYQLYYDKEANKEIITPGNVSSGSIHRGLLADYSAYITEYAKEKGFDGIISNGSDTPLEIVVFYPNQIKSVDNLYPTPAPNFKENIATLAQDVEKFNQSGRLFIAENLSVYKEFLPKEEVERIAARLEKDGSFFVRTAMSKYHQSLEKPQDKSRSTGMDI